MGYRNRAHHGPLHSTHYFMLSVVLPMTIRLQSRMATPNPFDITNRKIVSPYS